MAAQAGAAEPLSVDQGALELPIYRDCASEKRRAKARGNEEEIVVCGDSGAGSPYRIPVQPDRWDPKAGVASVSRERNGLLEGGGQLGGGLGSCSNVGPNGMNGCHAKGVWRHREQHGR